MILRNAGVDEFQFVDKNTFEIKEITDSVHSIRSPHLAYLKNRVTAVAPINNYTYSSSRHDQCTNWARSCVWVQFWDLCADSMFGGINGECPEQGNLLELPTSFLMTVEG